MENAKTIHRLSPRRGFTLVEIMIVVVIIGLLAALSIPSLQRVRRRSQNSRFVSDLRTYAQAFETYAMERGAWPPNAISGVIPAALVGEIANKWISQNSLGGRWNGDSLGLQFFRYQRRDRYDECHRHDNLDGRD